MPNRLAARRRDHGGLLLISDDERRAELLRRLLFSAGLRAPVEVAGPTDLRALRGGHALVALDATGGGRLALPGLACDLGRFAAGPLLVFAAGGQAAAVRRRLGAVPILELPASPAEVRARLRGLPYRPPLLI